MRRSTRAAALAASSGYSDIHTAKRTRRVARESDGQEELLTSSSSSSNLSLSTSTPYFSTGRAKEANKMKKAAIQRNTPMASMSIPAVNMSDAMHTSSAEQVIMELSDSNSDIFEEEEEDEWEQVECLEVERDLSNVNDDLVEEEIQEDQEEELANGFQIGPSSKTIEITFKQKLPKPKISIKGISKRDRLERADLHKAHLLCLLVATHIRNQHWCNSLELQGIMVSMCPLELQENIRKHHHYGSFRAHLMGLANWWRSFYVPVLYSFNEAEIAAATASAPLLATGTSGFSAGPRPHGHQLADMKLYGQQISASELGYCPSLDALMISIQLHRGTPDRAAILFCALLRGLGCQCRLVANYIPIKLTLEGEGRVQPRETSNSSGTEGNGGANSYSSEKKPSKVTIMKGAKRIKKQKNAAEITSHARATEIAAQPACMRLWVEVLHVAERKWVAIDPFQFAYDVAKDMEKSVARGIQYTVAFEASGYTIKDVTRRYAMQWGARTLKYRLESDSASSYPTLLGAHDGTSPYFTTRMTDGIYQLKPWWDRVLHAYCKPERLRNNLDALEDEELVTQQLSEGMPRTLTGLKNHPIYAIERHCKKFECIYPKEPVLGYVQNQAVYPRANVQYLHTNDGWIKEARVVKPGAVPVKMVKSRVAMLRSRAEGETNDTSSRSQESVMTNVYGYWQTDLYIAPPVIGGKIPRNQYNNIDLFKPEMLPEGAAHIDFPHVKRIASKMGIDFADAVVGFDFVRGRSVPVVNGIVIAAEYEESLCEAYAEEMARQAENAENERKKRVWQRWDRMAKGLLVRQHVGALFGDNNQVEDFAVMSGSGNNEDELRLEEASEKAGINYELGGGGFCID